MLQGAHRSGRHPQVRPARARSRPDHQQLGRAWLPRHQAGGSRCAPRHHEHGHRHGQRAQQFARRATSRDAVVDTSRLASRPGRPTESLPRGIAAFVRPESSAAQGPRLDHRRQMPHQGAAVRPSAPRPAGLLPLQRIFGGIWWLEFEAVDQPGQRRPVEQDRRDHNEEGDQRE